MTTSRLNALGVLVGIALVLTVLANADTARAHANFLRSEPPANSVLDTAPAQIQLWFTEPLEAGFSEVQVLNAKGERVDRGDSRVLAEDDTSMIIGLQQLEQAAYTVSWKALSKLDGHVTRGVFSLSIGVALPQTGSARPQEFTSAVPVEAAVRWLGYFSASALIGLLLFQLLVLRPAVAPLEEGNRALAGAELPYQLLIRWSWIWLLIATLAALIWQTVQLGGGGSLLDTLGQLLFGTRNGVVWLTRAALVLGLGAAIFRLGYNAGLRTTLLWLGLGGGVLLTTSLTSHSAAVADLTALALAADWLHQAAVATWVGGLVALAVVLPFSLRPLSASGRGALLARVVPRFSAVAMVAVALLFLSGVYLSWTHIGGLGVLLGTLYGQALVVKLGLAFAALTLGTVNLVVLRPRLAQAVANARVAAAEQLGRRFARTIRIEAGLVILVLLAAGVFTSLPPGKPTYQQILASRPLELNAVARDLSIGLAILPAKAGPSTFTTTVLDSSGNIVADAERVLLTFTYLDKPLGATPQPAEPQPNGAYTAQGPFMGVEGRWQVEVLVRRAGQDDARTAFRLQVSATTAEEITSGVGTPAAAPSRGSALQIAGLGLALLGVGLLIYLGRAIGLRSPTGQSLTLVSLAVVGLGIYLIVRPVSQPGVMDYVSMTNPFPPTQDSLAIGEGIYRNQCVVCHGASGRGDGPAAGTLNPPPADFRVHMAAGHTDGELFNWVTNGVPGTAMPAYVDLLTLEERWHAINFIRGFAPVESRAAEPVEALVEAGR